MLNKRDECTTDNLCWKCRLSQEIKKMFSRGEPEFRIKPILEELVKANNGESVYC